ncbi:D-alanine transaminase [Virgibacillus natechei]|uniref:D-alanine aminotransferase n=1 Tax=Virgibacillus natechei TaxID=1216297 RepID=A0ABS4IGQ6_9BACI|nr:D-amino-acid transaminase [Virgibacillus natechei]MBP1970135.1 D-alanine transaminase [Virgibacillus natechei]UZD14866.1 D-amino-acid transaminase [Virgibacillus natechei]
MSIYPIILTQSRFTHRDELTYPYEERGLQFGDGVYEVVRIYNGAYYLLEEHIDRLYRSAEAIKIELTVSKEELTNNLIKLLVQNDMTVDGKLYLQLTRGSAPRDHVFPVDTPANMYAYIQDLPRNIKNLETGVSATTEHDARWDYCYIKSLNLLPNVLAKQTAKENGCYEAILHKDGFVTECSASNVYLVKNGTIYTHPTTTKILHGCVRMRIEKFVDDLAIPFNEEGFTIEDISNADELFLTSSTSEVTPIIKVDNKQIADGKPGKITKQLQKAYEEDAAIKDTNVKHNV